MQPDGGGFFPMSRLYSYGGPYCPSPNQPVESPALNPKADNAMSNNTGNAGCDGYTVLSRANRYSGERPLVGSNTPVFEGPKLSEDY
jgi:hypothetical protein